MSQLNLSGKQACGTGTIAAELDGGEGAVNFAQTFASQTEAEQTLAYLTEKARATESEPCQIHSQLTETTQGWQLTAQFNFCCQAEAMIFQMALR